MTDGNDTAHSPNDRPIVCFGTIIDFGLNAKATVQLDTGEKVVAVISKPALRKVGYIGSPIGWRARVRLKQAPTMNRITELSIPPT